METVYGKIKVYGKIIDLDNMSIDELVKIKEVLDNRLEQLSKKYIELYNNL